jgi:glycosyltransferase involved in cell wall biosynthesis
MLVSIVIPAYNRGHTIHRAIRSVLAQTHQELEVIVVDDGSKDNTLSVLEQLCKADSRIRYLCHDSNKGAQAARNTGIRVAQGEWIAFLDSDDQWLPDSLEVRLRLAEERGVQVVHSDCYILRAGNPKLQRYGVPRMEGQVYKELLRRPGPMFPSLLVSKEALTNIGYLDEAIIAYQEWDTAIRLAKYYEFAFVPQPTFIYDCRHANTISKDLLRGARGYEQVFTKHGWSILRYLGPKVLASHYQTAASFYREAEDEIQARRCLLRAALLWPFRPKAIFRRAQRFFKLGDKR